jgi:hypothetical protein
MLGSALGFEDAEIAIYQVLAARTGAAHVLPLDRAELIAETPRSAMAEQQHAS